MRKITLFFVLLIGFGAHAQSLDYLTIRTTNGVEKSVTAVGTEITFGDGNMYVKSGTDEITFNFNDLSAMFFAAEPTGLRNVISDQRGLADIPAGSMVQVFNMAGKPVGTFRKQAGQQSLKKRKKKGVYILKANGVTFKSLVR